MSGLCSASPLVGSEVIGEEEHELVLLAGHRLVQWAEGIAHHAGDRFQPGAIRWNRTLVDGAAESVRLLDALLTETEQEVACLRATLRQIEDPAARDVQHG